MSRRYWTTEEDSLLTELVKVNKLSYREMSSKFEGRSGVSLLKRAQRLGLDRNGFVFCKHSHNKTFFQIPNPINCYVAGYIAADGHISESGTTSYIALALSIRDEKQIELFAKLMSFTGTPLLQPRKHWDWGNFSDVKILKICSAYELIADLKRNFGLTQKKTYRIPAPCLDTEELKLCYLAGLLDGDGCVHISNTDLLTISYTSCSLLIVEWVMNFTKSLQLKGIRSKKFSKISYHKNTRSYRFSIAGAKAVDLIERMQQLKAKGIPILDRKWDNPELNQYISEFKAKFSEKLKNSASI